MRPQRDPGAQGTSLDTITRGQSQEERVEPVPDPCSLGDQLITGVDEQLEI